MWRPSQMIWAAAACLSVGLASALRAGKRAPPRIAIEQHYKATGGPEALVQLLIACADAGGDCYASGSNIVPEFAQEYKSALGSHRLLHRRLPEKFIRKGDIVIVPEITACKKIPDDEGVLPYIYLLADRNMEPDACPRLAHNHYIASLPGVVVNATLTPYITPSIVEHARTKAGLQSDGGFHDLKALLAQKEDLVLVDGDSTVRGQLSALLPQALGGSNVSIALIGVETLELFTMPAGEHPSTVSVYGFTKKDLLELMLKAKVVVDLCMRGSERVPLEAALQGAVVITNNCQTGTDSVDIPVGAKHRLENGNDSALVTAIGSALQNYEAEVMDPGQVALRREYGSRLSRSSLSAEFRTFMEQLH